MVTRYAFGYGEGEIRRRRRQGQEAMRRQVESERAQLPEQERLDYDSDYYGFRGAGRRSGRRTEGQASTEERPRRSAQPDFRRTEPRRWGKT
jgi:hypothetical protein